MESVLEVKNLGISFELPEGTADVLERVSFTVRENEILGLVGESGCGKSVTALAILGILAKNARVRGEILLNTGNKTIDILKLNPKGEELRQIRGKDISMVFQEPAASFCQVYTIADHLIEAINLHKKVSKKEAREIAIDMLAKVKIPDPQKIMDSYPFELSGGMLQRCMIAIALSGNPKLLIADEPSTALDVTIQAQILYLMKELQREFQSSIILITHDLGVIAQMADRVIVMYLGHIVEEAGVYELFKSPLHPYTKALLRAIPKFGERKMRLEAIAGVVPDPYNLPEGCRFHNRCSNFIEGICNVREPEEIKVDGEHRVKCFLYGEGGNEQ